MCWLVRQHHRFTLWTVVAASGCNMAASRWTVDLVTFDLTGLLTGTVNSGLLNRSIWKCLLLKKTKQKKHFFLLWNYNTWIVYVFFFLSFHSMPTETLKGILERLLNMQGQMHSEKKKKNTRSLLTVLHIILKMYYAFSFTYVPLLSDSSWACWV